MDINERELSLQYLFHLKTLEYAKRHAKREINRKKNEIQRLNNEISRLAIPNNVASPNVRQPSRWYSFNWSGKWFVLLGLAILVICVLFSTDTPYRSAANQGLLLLLKILSIVFAIVSFINIFTSYNRNVRALKQYNEAVAQYNYYYNQERQKFSYESEVKNSKIDELNTHIQEEKELQDVIKSMKEARGLLYSVNFIPYQFRNLESVGFFYSQVKSSPIVLNDLIRYEPTRVSSGYNSIPDFIKVEDDIYSFPTINRIAFWNSCNALMQKIDKYISENDDQSLEQSMQKLIETINKEGLGMKYNFIGSVTAGVIGDGNKVTVPMSDYQPSIETAADSEMIKRIVDDLSQKIMLSHKENSQDLLRRLNELEPQLVRKEFEPKESWWERIKEGLEVFSNFAGIAGFALASYMQLQ